MTDTDMPLAQLLIYLQKLADASLGLWDLPSDARATLLNVSENITYLVQGTGGHKSILRVHRQDYHSRRAIECELAWLDALRSDGDILTPRYWNGKDGSAIQEVEVTPLQGKRFLVLFDFIDGYTPEGASDMTHRFANLGAMAAKCHEHVLVWEKPVPFERLTWNLDTVFGLHPTWGNWRDAPEVTQAVRVTLEEVEETIRTRLDRYGKSPNRYNLIHADMRLANLLVDGNTTRLIDFDDCGFGWLMYDFAAAISFIEDDPHIPELKSAWLRGYRSVRALNPADEAEIDTFIMMRRMALLAWIGSHIEAPEPQKLAHGFAETTARLGKAWLDGLAQR